MKSRRWVMRSIRSMREWRDGWPPDRALPTRAGRRRWPWTDESQRAFVARPGDVRFVQGHLQALEAARALTQPAGADRGRHALEDHPRHELGGGVTAVEFGQVVEVAEVELGERGLEDFAGEADIDHQAVGVEFAALEAGVDDVGGAVHALRRAEDGALEAVGDHDVVADGQAVHEGSPEWGVGSSWRPTPG